MNDITEPNVFGTVDGEEEEELCLEASEGSLRAEGAIIGGCIESELTEPDSTDGAGPEGDEEDWDSAPLGLYEENETVDCTGGGVITVSSGDTYTVDITIKVGSQTPVQISVKAMDRALQLFKKNRQKALLAMQGKACVEVGCQGECEPRSSWNADLRGTVTNMGTQYFNTGTSSAHVILTLKISIMATNTLRVACFCDE